MARIRDTNSVVATTMYAPVRLKLAVSRAEASSPVAPPARTASPSMCTVPNVRVRSAVRETSIRSRPAPLV